MNCEHSAGKNAATCRCCMQLQLVKGRLVKACMCSCSGCNEQQGADPADAEGAVEVTTGGDQQQKADGAAAEASQEQARRAGDTRMADYSARRTTMQNLMQTMINRCCVKHTIAEWQVNS